MSIICSSCGQIENTFINDSNIDTAVSSRTNIIQFFINYHIAVNTLYRQKIVRDNTLYNASTYNVDFITTRYNTAFIDSIKSVYYSDSIGNTKIVFDSVLNATFITDITDISDMDSFSFFNLLHSYVKLIYKTHSDKYNLQLKFSKIILENT